MLRQDNKLAELLPRIRSLGFEWSFTTDLGDRSRWVTLHWSGAPPRIRYQFEASPAGMQELEKWLIDNF